MPVAFQPRMTLAASPLADAPLALSSSTVGDAPMAVAGVQDVLVGFVNGGGLIAIPILGAVVVRNRNKTAAVDKHRTRGLPLAAAILEPPIATSLRRPTLNANFNLAHACPPAPPSFPPPIDDPHLRPYLFLPAPHYVVDYVATWH